MDSRFITAALIGTAIERNTMASSRTETPTTNGGVLPGVGGRRGSLGGRGGRGGPRRASPRAVGRRAAGAAATGRGRSGGGGRRAAHVAGRPRRTNGATASLLP